MILLTRAKEVIERSELTSPFVGWTWSAEAIGLIRISQQPLCILLRQPASDHLLQHSSLAIKLVAFCKFTLV